VETDILGAGYVRRTLELGSDDEGPVVATLVGRPTPRPTGRAVLYVHGWADYFFQTHLADWYVDRGFDFYAIDLRKYGRSLLPHQTPNFVRDVREYFTELDRAVDIIRTEDGHDRLLVNAHSTGGLIAALWAHHIRDRGTVDALFLNSPFFDFNVSRLTLATLGPLYRGIARFRPYTNIPRGVYAAYGHSIHADHHGEWDFDLTWKPLSGLPIKVGWINAILDAQAEIRAGLAIDAPILLACATKGYRKQLWSEEAMSADAVLNPDHIAARAGCLGRHVTVVRIDGGLHDLILSAPPVRERMFAELDHWLAAYLPE
jgi:alpha-beta hydrolase superfamily lysophospholipase